MGELNLNNVVVVKSVLRCFELASNLKVNFSKSRFGGIGVDQQCVERFAKYLNCKILKFPFLYLGISNRC